MQSVCEWDIEQDIHGAARLGFSGSVGRDDIRYGGPGYLYDQSANEWDIEQQTITAAGPESIGARGSNVASLNQLGWGSSYAYAAGQGDNGTMEINAPYFGQPNWGMDSWYGSVTPMEVDPMYRAAHQEPVGPEVTWGLRHRNDGPGDMEVDGMDYEAMNIDNGRATWEEERNTHTASPRPSPSPIELFNPFEDGAESAYLKIESAEGITYRHASAGDVVQKAGSEKSVWQKMREENIEKYGGCQWGRWETQREWEDARWMATTKTSQGALEELLQTHRYARNPPRFKTVKNLFSIIKVDLAAFSGPEWVHADVKLPEAPGERHSFFYRNLEKCGDFLFGTPRFAGKMAFAPTVVLGKDGVREYTSPHTADYLNKRQRLLQPGTTLLGTILMSDAMQLSRFSGDVQAHAVYMSLTNVDKDIRNQISNGAWLLVRLIPKSTWDKSLSGVEPKTRRMALMHLYNRRLFHRCMEVLTRPLRKTEPHEALDPEGNTRLVQQEMVIYGADLEEQCHIEGTSPNSCPHCLSKGSELGDPGCQCARSSETIMRDIKTVLRTFNAAYGRNPGPWEFLEEGRRYGLNGVHKPWWRRLPAFDICQVLSPDMLHGIHKMFFDHIHRWNVNSLGDNEFDTRLKAQIPTFNQRMFPQGVTKLQQLSGKEHRGLERVHLPIIAHAPTAAEGGSGSNKLTKATQAIMDCIFLAQYPTQTDRTLAAFDKSYQDFHANKDIWINNGTKRNKKKKKKKKKARGSTRPDGVIEGWAIPKIHILRHIPEHVKLKGSMDNFNTETMEHLH
ncbi:hypothetical protein FRC06_011822 [Ceratobasidium sp. 370]|nr:hypothetical protein FRC06_011822 [Ceratobasidium sp. 370]